MGVNDGDCWFEGCTVQAKSKGLCGGHYQQQHRGYPLTPIHKNRRFRGRVATESEAECTRCRRLLSMDRFTAGSGALGKAGWCKDCMVSWRYGISTPTLLRMREMAGRVCPICETESDLHVDHDHRCCPGGRSCGRCVRGLLCGSCNRAIGLLRDDPKILASAMAYLAAFGDPTTKVS